MCFFTTQASIAPPSTSVHLLHNQLIASRCLSKGDKRSSDESVNRFSQCKLHTGGGRFVQHLMSNKMIQLI